MQLASSGARTLWKGRQVAHIGSGASPTRSIHTPGYVPRPTTKPVTSTAQVIFRRTRTLLSSFVSHLTAPGLVGKAGHIPAAAGRSLYPPPTHARSIHQGLSFPLRYALGRPLHSPHLPRAHAVPRGVTQVGLGTARNFSTGRPIFQSLADNVPVVGRAFWEADLEIKMMEERARIAAKTPTKRKENKKRKEMFKPRPVEVSSAPVTTTVSNDAQKNEFNHYFPVAAVPDVITYLLIPLAPTPTNRLPLRDTPHIHSSTHPLLPFSLISSLHADHSTHALRVSSVFARLDSSRVFDDSGVTCSAFGDPSGLCTVLEVKFDGWSEHRVRSVLGEAGMGWCVLEEVRKYEEAQERDAMDDILSNMSSENTRPSSPSPMRMDIDPSTSFVLPTLDFSASFPTQSNVWPSPHPSEASTPLSDLTFHNEWTTAMSHAESDALSDSGSDNISWPDSLSDPSSEYPLSRSSSFGSESWMGMGFSSQFAGQVERLEGANDWHEPREYLF